MIASVLSGAIRAEPLSPIGGRCAFTQPEESSCSTEWR